MQSVFWTKCLFVPSVIRACACTPSCTVHWKGRLTTGRFTASAVLASSAGMKAAGEGGVVCVGEGKGVWLHCLCVCVCMFGCVSGYTFMCVCVLCACTYVQMFVHTSPYVSVCRREGHTDVCTCICAHRHMFIHAHSCA